MIFAFDLFFALEQENTNICGFMFEHKKEVMQMCTFLSKKELLFASPPLFCVCPDTLLVQFRIGKCLILASFF